MNRIEVDAPAKRSGFLSILRVSGDDFPDEASIEFTRGGRTVTVRPALARPHWLLIDALPLDVPLGANEVRVIADGWSSEIVVVTVWGTAPEVARVLFPGRPVANPYTIAFVGNPAIVQVDGVVVQDPVMTNRPAFVRAVVSCLSTYLTLDEDIFRRQGLERLIRFVSLFDPTSQAELSNALSSEYADFPYMNPERERGASYLNRRGLQADVLVVINGSTSHMGATSPGTHDDFTGGTVDYEYDGATKSHGLSAAIPGATALNIYDHRAPVALHEFGHAASEYGTAFVIDAYTDKGDSSKPWINKKRRAKPGDPLPATFGTYERKTYGIDPTPGGLPYPATWRSYLPEPVVRDEYNLMDYYPKATRPERCKFDALTREWLFARLWSKANR